MKIELRQIRYFEAVARELNFHKAAERLHMSQPALSRAIQLLENRLGTPLFERNNRNVTLTQAGKIFLEGSQSISQRVDSLEKRIMQSTTGEVGSLTIGYTDFAVAGNFPKLITTFQKDYPGINLELRHIFSLQQTIMLKTQKLDFGFLTLPMDETELSYIPIQNDSFVVVLPNDHPLTTQSEIELNSLVNEPFIVGINEEWEVYNVQMNALCLKAGFLPKVKQEAYNSEGIFGLIAANMGITIYPSCVTNYFRHGITIRPIRNNDAKLISAVAWNNEHVSLVHKRFIDFMRNTNDY